MTTIHQVDSIASLAIGQRVDLIAGVAEVGLRQKNAGGQFVDYQLTDSTGAVRAILWDPADLDGVSPQPKRGCAVKVRGLVKQAFKSSGVEIEVSRIKVLAAGEYEPSRLLPMGKIDPQTGRARLAEIIASVDCPELRRLLGRIFSGEFLEAFLLAPAAKMHHHATVGGLLEHTLEVCELATAVQPLYPYVDRSFLLTGALLHDHAKVWEYTTAATIDFSDLGRLVGHIALGMMHASKVADELDLPEDLRLRVLHLIAAHQGKYEFASPKLPQTPEAELLFRLDDLSSTMWKVRKAYESAAGEEERWTSWNKDLGRQFFRPALAEPIAPRRDASVDGAVDVSEGF